MPASASCCAQWTFCALVEACLELDEDARLPSRACAAQRVHRRSGSAVRAVQRQLDRRDGGVVGRLFDQSLNRGREVVVRVVDEPVALPHQVEHGAVWREGIARMKRRKMQTREAAAMPAPSTPAGRAAHRPRTRHRRRAREAVRRRRSAAPAAASNGAMAASLAPPPRGPRRCWRVVCVSSSIACSRSPAPLPRPRAHRFASHGTGTPAGPGAPGTARRSRGRSGPRDARTNRRRAPE